MAGENVKYTLSLEDLLTGKLHGANAAAKGLEETIGSLKNQLIGFFGLMGSFEFLKGAYEDFEKLHQAEAQLENTLKNVGERAGMTKDELVDMAKAAAHEVNYTADQFVGAESMLSRFRNINKETFQEALKTTADLSTVNKASLEENARNLGRILEAPAENSRLLRQFNLSLTESQREYIKHLEETGNVAKAQAYILQELADKGYANAAATEAQTDPLFRFKKTMEETKLEIGEGITKVIEDLQPLLLWLVDHFKELVEWITRNTGTIKSFVIALGTAWAAFKIGTAVIIPFIEGLETIPVAAVPAAEGIESVGAASTLALGPLGLLAAAIGAVVLAYQNMADAKEQAAADHSNFLAKIEKEESTTLDDMVGDYMKKAGDSMEQAIKDAKDFEKRGLQSALDQNFKDLSAITGDSDDDNTRRSNLQGRQELLLHQMDVVKGWNGPKKQVDPAKGGAGASPSETKGVSGPKVVSINVSIKNLIDNLTIKTVSVSESATQARQMVTQALVSAVNDAEILAGR